MLNPDHPYKHPCSVTEQRADRGRDGLIQKGDYFSKTLLKPIPLLQKPAFSWKMGDSTGLSGVQTAALAQPHGPEHSPQSKQRCHRQDAKGTFQPPVSTQAGSQLC